MTSLREFAQKICDPSISLSKHSLLGPLEEPTLEYLITELVRQRSCSRGHSLSRQSFSGPIVVVVPSDRTIHRWQDFLEQMIERQELSCDSRILPAVHGYGANRNSVSDDQQFARVGALFRLATAGSASCQIVITTMAGLLQTTLSPSALCHQSISISKSSEFEQEDLRVRLLDMGYALRPMVEQQSQFSVRGNIIDVFPPSETYPIRIETFGDTVTSIRSFQLETQQSLVELQSAMLGPAVEFIWAAEEREASAQKVYEYFLENELDPIKRDGIVRSILNGHRFTDLLMVSPLMRDPGYTALDFLDEDAYFVFTRSVSELREGYVEFLKGLEASRASDQLAKRLVLPTRQHFIGSPNDFSRLTSHSFLESSSSAEQAAGVHKFTVDRSAMGTPPLAKSREVFAQWASFLAELHRRGVRILIYAKSKEHIDQVRDLLAHRALFDIEIQCGYLSGVVWLGDQIIVPESVLFGATGQPEQSQRSKNKLKNYLGSFRDVQKGTLLVHVDHGIGRYVGLVELEVSGAKVACLHLEYKDGDRVYVPVDRLQLLQRYGAPADGDINQLPQVDKLQSQSWSKRKSSARKAVQDLAETLLKLQAERSLAKAPPLSSRDDDYYKFEAAFPYVETEDQLRAISDAHADLDKDIAMDRLICGDVGFGKTEVALRCAFRAVKSGYQVMVLVPTTVLCYQHFKTLSHRLSAFSVRVAQINRFVGTRQIAENLREFSKGSIDILVGTHRLLSKDVVPKHLGLVIVDEEQKFGVAHKEALKGLRAGSHVLTMSATPIPRTLHMAMLGLREISIVATPPANRLAVKTYVSQFDPDLIARAIEDEIARGGQVFFVHNRIDDILRMRQQIAELVPRARVAVGHGKMTEDKLERVILDFTEQKFDVLLCTTIIESGIDMPNVNTLIVNDAHHFGLSQLYQLRGRVGRALRQAYAYFIVPQRGDLSDDVRTRLDVMVAHQGLGSGFQIARHDLELRGVGNLLGAEQSGHIADIGIEMYTDMVEQAMNELRGKVAEAKTDPEIKIPFTAIIPESYVADEKSRLDLYKRLFAMESVEDRDALSKEIEDRFGRLPQEVLILTVVAEIKRLLTSIKAVLASINRLGEVEIKFAGLTELQIQTLYSIPAANKNIRLSSDFRLILRIGEPWSTNLAVQLSYGRKMVSLLMFCEQQWAVQIEENRHE